MILGRKQTQIRSAQLIAIKVSSASKVEKDGWGI